MQVGIYLNDSHMGKSHYHKYENPASYLTLLISDWIKQQKLDLGEFNRVFFTEASLKEDCTIVGIKVFNVHIPENFKGLDQFKDAQTTHEYFMNQYIAGFKRFDAHFDLNLTPALIAYLEDYFKNGLQYEKEMHAKRIGGLKYIVLSQYKYDVFNLVLRIVDKTGKTINESTLTTTKPDTFINYYNFNKVKILENKIQVLGRTDDVKAEFPLGQYLVH